MRHITLAVVVLMLAVAADGGQVPRDTPQAATGTAAIGGTVVTDEPQPRTVRRARVHARATELGPNGLTVVTDDRGAFSLSALPAGRYTLSVEKEGWSPFTYGASRPGRPGTSIVLAGGQQVTGLTIRIPRSGVITGSVFDHNGQPATGANVRAMRYRYIGGLRRLGVTGVGGAADDRGVYRIHSLPAGEYVVVATVPRGGPFSSADLAITAPADVTRARQELSAPAASQASPGMRAAAARTAGARPASVTYAPVYYPGTPVATQATMIPVTAGEERGGIDIQLQLVPTSRIEGTVSLPEGVTAKAVAVSLVALGEDLASTALFLDSSYRTARLDAEGRFTFASIKPGQYIVSARGQAPGEKTDSGLFQLGTLWAATEISVDGNDVSNVVLDLQPGLTVSGRIQFDTADPQSAPDPSKFRVNLGAAPGQVTFGSSPGIVDASGAFTIRGVTPGRYSVSAGVPNVVPNASKWVLESAIVAGRDTLDVPLEIRAGQHVDGVVLTYTDRPSELTGVVQDAAGRPAADYSVMVFAADRAFWTPQSRRIRSARPDQEGKYTLRNLPAGEYLVVAALDVEQDEWFDPSFLQRVAPSAIRIAIADGEKKVQDLRIGG